MLESSGAAYSPRTTRAAQFPEPPQSSYVMGRVGPPGALLAQQRSDPLQDEPERV